MYLFFHINTKIKLLWNIIMEIIIMEIIISQLWPSGAGLAI